MQPTIFHSSAWQALEKHQRSTAQWQMRDLFSTDPERFNRFSIEAACILLDFSKNRINRETIALLSDLALAAGLPLEMEKMRQGVPINVSENRAVLHVALREQGDYPYQVNGEPILPGIRKVLRQMRRFVDHVLTGAWTGFTDKKITDVVNIGIGGSDLGPRMAVEALQPYANTGVKCHFLSNIDPEHIHQVLAGLNPETTLFIVVSKSFSTLETQLNAVAARKWLVDALGDESAVAKHFVGVTTNKAAATAFGIQVDNLFEMWDWVGGRYSVWSAVGLILAFAIGMDEFEAFLAGGASMDQHFFSAPIDQNMPIIMALIGIWYNTFYKAHTHAVMPYVQGLQRLPAHLQQLDMESNGKRAGKQGEPILFDTGPVIWGDVGVNVQHAFFQLLHQGTRLVPCDFIATVNPHFEVNAHQANLLANCLAQSEALMKGKTTSEAQREMLKAGLSEQQIEALLPHKVFPGNQPSNTLLLRKLDPKTLGALLALYEHKVFVQGVIWGINSFDQWGVEYGKQLALDILPLLSSEKEKTNAHDPSTMGLIQYFHQHRHSME
ncbi:glucose-6-phosphate isomerase [Leeia sp. TBRC 13508]|uniref:Glucose-6-phosphate isomerase n=1 Tax=Leeia speluncae TaxID=2884804 RepID=A0ABS8D8H7_9NEIS|nr:glucose-6-phosphate isomerase [Leeia speluncae]MCB6184500.1 glucose-6-phosphate isomerase [Leeia speluncae]